MTKNYVTYVEMTFNSEGADPVKVIEILEDMGFSPTRGQHDFEYHWGKDPPTMEMIKSLLTRLHKRLEGCKVLYQVTTI